MAEANTINSGIDERLMASQLREEKNKEKNGQEGEGEQPKDEEQAKTFRQKIIAARQALDIKEKAKKKIEEAITAPIGMGTARLLQMAWGSIFSVVGFIFLGLPYINIHVFCRFVFGEKLFCKLGDEWMLTKGAAKIGGEATETAGRGIGMAEWIIFIISDIIVLVILGAFAFLIIMIVTWMSASWTEKLKMIFDAIRNFGGFAFSVLESLF